MKNKFSPREDSRLLSAPLPIVTLGPPLFRCQMWVSTRLADQLRFLSMFREQLHAWGCPSECPYIQEGGARLSLNPLLILHREVPSRAAHLFLTRIISISLDFTWSSTSSLVIKWSHLILRIDLRCRCWMVLRSLMWWRYWVQVSLPYIISGMMHWLYTLSFVSTVRSLFAEQANAILENMYVVPKNFGVAPGDLCQLLVYFTQIFGVSNPWRGVNLKHFEILLIYDDRRGKKIFLTLA